MPLCVSRHILFAFVETVDELKSASGPVFRIPFFFQCGRGRNFDDIFMLFSFQERGRGKLVEKLFPTVSDAGLRYWFFAGAEKKIPGV